MFLSYTSKVSKMAEQIKACITMLDNLSSFSRPTRESNPASCPLKMYALLTVVASFLMQIVQYSTHTDQSQCLSLSLNLCLNNWVARSLAAIFSLESTMESISNKKNVKILTKGPKTQRSKLWPRQ